MSRQSAGVLQKADKLTRQGNPRSYRRMRDLPLPLFQHNRHGDFGINPRKRARIGNPPRRTDQPHQKHNQSVQQRLPRLPRNHGINRPAAKHRIHQHQKVFQSDQEKCANQSLAVVLAMCFNIFHIFAPIFYFPRLFFHHFSQCIQIGKQPGCALVAECGKYFVPPPNRQFLPYSRLFWFHLFTIHVLLLLSPLSPITGIPGAWRRLRAAWGLFPFGGFKQLPSRCLL